MLTTLLAPHRLGTLQDFDVPRVLDELLAWYASHRHLTSPSDRPPLCAPFWRGRMGLDKDAQIALYSRTVAESE